MILKTERLVLRPQAMDDAAALFAILGDGEAMRFWSRPPIARLAVVEELMREQQDAMTGGFCRYWTVLENGDVIGSVDLSLIENGSAELGFLMRRDRWGAGLGTEAVRTVIAQAFGALQLKRLAAAAQMGNFAARRVLEKCGFAQIAAHSGIRLAGGNRADCAFYALNAS